MKIQANIAGTKSRLTESDLCVLLSNALENAIHACCELETVDKKQEIDVTIYEKSDKFFLEVINPCRDGIRFKNDVPISEQPGHGVGVQSICAVAQRYQGVYFFGVQDGKFVLRVSI